MVNVDAQVTRGGRTVEGLTARDFVEGWRRAILGEEPATSGKRL